MLRKESAKQTESPLHHAGSCCDRRRRTPRACTQRSSPISVPPSKGAAPESSAPAAADADAAVPLVTQTARAAPSVSRGENTLFPYFTRSLSRSPFSDFDPLEVPDRRREGRRGEGGTRKSETLEVEHLSIAAGEKRKVDLTETEDGEES